MHSGFSGLFPVPPSYRAIVQRMGGAGLESPATLYSGRSRQAAVARARQVAQDPWPNGTRIGVLGPCPHSWIGNASCYACLQKKSQLGWHRATPTIDACSAPSYLGAFGAAPAPPSRPKGPAAPAGERPLPDSSSSALEPGAQAPGTINPFYVGLAVTVGVMVAMVIWE